MYLHVLCMPKILMCSALAKLLPRDVCIIVSWQLCVMPTQLSTAILLAAASSTHAISSIDACAVSPLLERMLDRPLCPALLIALRRRSLMAQLKHSACSSARMALGRFLDD